MQSCFIVLILISYVVHLCWKVNVQVCCRRIQSFSSHPPLFSSSSQNALCSYGLVRVDSDTRPVSWPPSPLPPPLRLWAPRGCSTAPGRRCSAPGSGGAWSGRGGGRRRPGAGSAGSAWWSGSARSRIPAGSPRSAHRCLRAPQRKPYPSTTKLCHCSTA